MLNKQFCATTSTEASDIGKAKASPSQIVTKLGSNQGFSLAATCKLRAAASRIAATGSTAITPPGRREK